MAFGDEEIEDEVNSPFEDYSLSDWEDAYSELLDKYDDLKRNNKHLKKKLNQIVHDKTDKEKIINLENQINELKDTLINCEQDKICITEIRYENKKLLCEIDEIKIKIQKYLEESNISKEKYEAIKSVNNELQNNAVKLRKDLDEKHKILEFLTQGKENLNTILGSKINVNKEGLGYVPKIKKKYDVITMNFVPQ